jgi:putative tryptophan/tyrosine transport system substrate-binding protein
MMTKKRANAAIIFPDSFFVQESRSIAAQALKHRLPSISTNHEYSEAGGLMTYGPNLNDNFRRAAGYVDKILLSQGRTSTDLNRPNQRISRPLTASPLDLRSVEIGWGW